jgi:hypothetical protein
MSFVADYNQYVALLNHLNSSCRDAFDKIQEARLLYSDEYHDDATRILRGYVYASFWYFQKENKIMLSGKIYSGNGEYDYGKIGVPINALDNIEEWIKERRLWIGAKQRERHAAKKAQRVIDKETSKQYRLQGYLELKKEFEPDGANS